MKRVLVGTIGFTFGLLLTWLCLYLTQQKGVTGGGCLDRGYCSWWVAPLLISYVFLLPILFGLLNGVAWQRWSIRKWGYWFITLTIITIVIHLWASYGTR